MQHSNPLDPAAFAALEALIARIAPEWLGKPNIVAIVPALKTRRGVVQPGQLVLGFYVREKVAQDLLEDRGYPPIPSAIEGVPTDVIPATRQPLGSVDCKNTRSQMFDTLAGGMAVGNANMNAYGTLAMILFAQSDGHAVGLTNEHVLVYDGDGHVGDEVQQPRFYLNSEVSIDSAACCPNGQLHYRPVDNPIVDASAAVFAAAALAAALSDTIDPHRRGQAATVPDAGERTRRETVAVQMQYPEIPFPGRPYALDVKWQYQRMTDRRTLDYGVSEIQNNPHVVGIQELVTDRHQYLRADTVIFYALLGPEPHRETCGNYFVTAAALSPSHRRAYKVILKPWQGSGELRTENASHSVQREGVRRCVAFANQKPDDCFREPRTISEFVFDPNRHTACFVRVAAGQPPGLRFWPGGLTVRFPSPVQEVIARVTFERGPVKMTAYNGSTEVGSAVSTGEPPATLQVSAAAITHVVLQSEDKSPVLLEICTIVRLDRFCVYRGEVQLAHDDELGMWSTYLFAQTLNDVPQGTDPLVAATTIGGLPVTNNFVDGGGYDNITYGHACLVDLAPNGQFEVIAPPPANIG